MNTPDNIRLPLADLMQRLEETFAAYKEAHERMRKENEVLRSELARCMAELREARK